MKQYGISEGDTLVQAGYFYPFPGKDRIQPLVRQGILAMLPDEKLPTTMGKDGNLYLADMHVLGGNSGSPVFVNLAGIRRGRFYAGVNVRLLGVVSGYFFEDQDLRLRITTIVEGKAKANSGISAIVPVDELLNLLNKEELRVLRETRR